MRDLKALARLHGLVPRGNKAAVVAQVVTYLASEKTNSGSDAGIGSDRDSTSGDGDDVAPPPAGKRLTAKAMRELATTHEIEVRSRASKAEVATALAQGLPSLTVVALREVAFACEVALPSRGPKAAIVASLHAYLEAQAGCKIDNLSSGPSSPGAPPESSPAKVAPGAAGR